jgi:hypothetical protein
MKITFCKDTRAKLLEIKRTKGIAIEGNILKLIDYSNDPELEEYIKESIKLQKSIQRKRLDVTKRVQSQNEELVKAQSEIERVNHELNDALAKAEKAKDSALKDLDLLQKKTQLDLIRTIVKVALIVIVSTGITTTGLYMFSILTDKDTQIIGNAWSNMLGILITNSFSIIGTIMGVKYATRSRDEEGI